MLLYADVIKRLINLLCYVLKVVFIVQLLSGCIFGGKFNFKKTIYLYIFIPVTFFANMNQFFLSVHVWFFLDLRLMWLLLLLVYIANELMSCESVDLFLNGTVVIGICKKIFFYFEYTYIWILVYHWNAYIRIKLSQQEQ